MLLLIIRIIKEKNKHGQHSSDVDRTLSPNKILHKGSLIKKYSTHIHKSMNFKFLKK